MHFDFYLNIWAILGLVIALVCGAILLLSKSYWKGYESADEQRKREIATLKKDYACLSPEFYFQPLFIVGGYPEEFFKECYKKYQTFISKDPYLYDLFQNINDENAEELSNDLSHYLDEKCGFAYRSGNYQLVFVYLHMIIDIYGKVKVLNSSAAELLADLYLEEKDYNKAILYLNYAYFYGDKNRAKLKFKLKQLAESHNIFSIDNEKLKKAADFLELNRNFTM